ncbi:hypothetical protein BGW80DRAFT_43637 [Lactifluus volemus]|nr:hypothetical protein BGW80DRAFT_43637 [Lactifluus volemus]
MYGNDVEGDFFLRAWQIINEISDQLAHNQKFTSSLLSQAETLQAEAGNVKLDFTLKRFNVDISKESLESELERTNAQIIIENHALQQENKQLSLLLKEYEQTMDTIMMKFRSHTQDAARHHQVTLTEHYEILLAHEPSLSSQLATDPALNTSLHRLHRVLQAALLCITGHDPTEALSEGSSANVEAGDSQQPLGTSPPPPPEEPTSHEPILAQLDAESGIAQSPPQPSTLTLTSHLAQVVSESQPEGSEPDCSETSQAGAVNSATATATAGANATTTTTDTTTTTKPIAVASQDQSTTSPDLDSDAVTAELDWAETREREIARLESENAHIRALLGIDPKSLSVAGVPDIDPESPLITSFRDAREPVPAGSSAWANVGSEAANPFTLGFREDPSVLGLAATPSRLHTLTPPNAPHAMMTPATATATTSTTTATATAITVGGSGISNSGNGGRGSGVFVSASWVPSVVAAGNGLGPAAVVPHMQQAQQQQQQHQHQQQKPLPPSLGIASLARTMELQGPGVGGGGGRGRGVLFAGRGRSVAW